MILIRNSGLAFEKKLKFKVLDHVLSLTSGLDVRTSFVYAHFQSDKCRDFREVFGSVSAHFKMDKDVPKQLNTAQCMCPNADQCSPI